MKKYWSQPKLWRLKVGRWPNSAFDSGIFQKWQWKYQKFKTPETTKYIKIVLLVVLFGLWLVYISNLAHLRNCKTFSLFLGTQEAQRVQIFEFLNKNFQIFKLEGRNFKVGIIWHWSHYVFVLVWCVFYQKLHDWVAGSTEKKLFLVRAYPQIDTVSLNEIGKFGRIFCGYWLILPF